MRKPFFALALLALALPVAATSAVRAGEGTLSVEDGRGKVLVQAKGGVIGRLERGSVTIFDLTPRDGNDPVVIGADRPVREIGLNGLRYAGTGIRFRVIGGSFRVVVDGRGIDLSVVGKGQGAIKGDGASPGLYSLDGADCRHAPDSCSPLPDTLRRFQLGKLERGERNAARSARTPG